MRTGKQRGFSYLGLLMLVALTGLSAAASVSLGAAAQRRDAEEELLFIGEEFRLAFQSYDQATPNGQPRHPPSLQDLLKDPRFPGTRRHLRQLYTDPITGRSDWVLVMAPEAGIVGVHSASGARPIKSARFPAAFSGFEGATKYSQWVFSHPACCPRRPAL